MPKKIIRIQNNHPHCPHDKDCEEYIELYKTGKYLKIVTRFRIKSEVYNKDKDKFIKKWVWSNECDCYPKISVDKIRSIF